MLKGHTNGVTSVAASPAGTYFATGSRDQTARIWSYKTGRVSKTKQGLPVHICDICRPPKVRGTPLHLFLSADVLTGYGRLSQGPLI
jgi:WD40 repeat protein